MTDLFRLCPECHCELPDWGNWMVCDDCGTSLRAWLKWSVPFDVTDLLVGALSARALWGTP